MKETKVIELKDVKSVPTYESIIDKMEEISGLKITQSNSFITIESSKYKFAFVEINYTSGSCKFDDYFVDKDVIFVSYYSKSTYYMKALTFFALELLGAEIDEETIPEWTKKKWQDIPFWRKNSFFI